LFSIVKHLMSKKYVVLDEAHWKKNELVLVYYLSENWLKPNLYCHRKNLVCHVQQGNRMPVVD
jgi:hypothetical protein